MTPASIPLRLRIPVEYAVTMSIGVFIAWLYEAFANAEFLLALALGLTFVLGFWLFMQLSPRTRGRGIHVLTAAALTMTLFVVLRLAGVA